MEKDIVDTYKLFTHGLAWLRADFHLHTKGDNEFPYTGNDFVKDYTEALIAANINIGIITNHNKFDLEEFKALRKEALKKQIYLLPGIEFSARDGARGIHVLIVFQEDWIFNKENKNYIEDFLISAFAGIANSTIPPYPNSRYNLEDLYIELNQFNKDYFFVLAHVDEKNGLFQELEGRNLEAFVKQEAFTRVLAVQKSGNKDKYENLCRLAGRTIACVEGTDNAQKGIKAIIQNQRVCFLKLGDFNFDAIKFALVAHEQRVRLKERHQTKNAHIRSIEFIGGLLDKQKINFSPELNSLIGIRGSGKSAIIEIIRYALGIPFAKTSVDQEYKNSLVEYVLGSGGKVIVELVNRHGEIYKIEKIFKQKEDIYKDNILQTGITIDAIIEKPIYFGQKDLSNKDADFEADLLKRLIGNKLDNVKKQIERKKEEIKEVIFQIQKTKNLEEEKKETLTAIENARHQLKLFQEYGIEEKLRSQTNYESDITKLSNHLEDIKQFINSLKEILKDYTLFDIVPELSEANKKYQETIVGLFASFREEKNKIEQSIEGLTKNSNDLDCIINAIARDRDTLKEEFAKIKREINQPSLNPERFIELNRTIQTGELKLKEINRLAEQRSKLYANLNENLVELNTLWHTEFNILKEGIEKINTHQQKLSIEIEYKGRKDVLFEALKRYFRGCNIRDILYQEIANKYLDFIEIYKDKDSLGQFLNLNQLNEFNKKFYDNLYDLLTFRVEDRILIKYNGKELSKHSLGQRASALILFLLSQKEQDILIIDQPEDDMDNQTIYDEVIKEIHRLKGTMQFIFATHNANIPVLGDSEKVVVCQYDEQRVIVNEGTIDNSDIQQAIINIMEGGKEAFNRRKDIYGIWRSNQE